MKQEEFKKEVLPLRKQLAIYAGTLVENREDTEDIIQEVFLKLWYMRTELKQYDSIPALSIQITKHLCLNYLKRQKQHISPEDALLVSNQPSPYQQVEQRDKLEKVEQIIDGLPNLQQTVLRMKHIDGFEVEEIAEITGSTPEAIRMNLSRARKQVRSLFFKMETA